MGYQITFEALNLRGFIGEFCAMAILGYLTTPGALNRGFCPKLAGLGKEGN